MARLLRGLLGLMLIGWMVSFVGGLAVAYRLKRDAPPPPDPAADEIDLVASLDQLDFKSSASSFRGGRLVCAFGGGVLDLRGATLDPGGARLETQAIYGGAQILVPDDWRVTTGVRGIGGVGDSRGGDHREDGPTLHIDGFALFGGFGVSSAPAS